MLQPKTVENIKEKKKYCGGFISQEQQNRETRLLKKLTNYFWVFCFSDSLMSKFVIKQKYLLGQN